MQPRLRTRTFNPSGKNAINQHMRINVMYSKAKYARGKVSRVRELHVNDSGVAYWVAHINYNGEKGEVRSKFVAVPLPERTKRATCGSTRRGSFAASCCRCRRTRRTASTRNVRTCSSTSGASRAKSPPPASTNTRTNASTTGRGTRRWDVLDQVGSVDACGPGHDVWVAAHTVIPRERRELVDDLACIQMHLWNNVPYDWHSADRENLSYEVDWEKRSINDVALRFDEFLRRLRTGACNPSPSWPPFWTMLSALGAVWFPWRDRRWRSWCRRP